MSVSAAPRPPRSADEVCLCSALRRAARGATRLYDDLMRPSGLKTTQFALLRNVGRAGTTCVTDLARQLDLERTAMGRNLDLLERKGLIQTANLEADQRTRVISLTTAGQRAVEAALPVWRRAQQEMKRRLGKGEFASLGAVIAQLNAKPS
jgi:DNA-binding MarR family transcriptional regulator